MARISWCWRPEEEARWPARAREGADIAQRQGQAQLQEAASRELMIFLFGRPKLQGFPRQHQVASGWLGADTAATPFFLLVYFIVYFLYVL